MRALTIFGGSDDPHLTRIAKILYDYGVDVFFWDPLKLIKTSIVPDESTLINKCELLKFQGEKHFKRKITDISNHVLWGRNKKG